MLFRFSLYGFLKNQRYFEPFLMLAFLEQGLSFTMIGWLITCRAITVNLLEIPSGAIADSMGRRSVMRGSFVAYLFSFLTFGFANSWLWFIPAMVLFGIGDSFRTGTHKAMIFEWLRLNDRTDERTKVYGFTRSWSKFGSAVSGILAAIFVLVSDSYRYIFLFAAIPCLLNLINFAGYPRELDGARANSKSAGSLATAYRRTRATLSRAIKQSALRGLLMESMSWEGVFHAAKDYLQPVLAVLAVSFVSRWLGDSSDSIATSLSPTQQTAILIGPVYALLFFFSGIASRHAHRLPELAGTTDRATRWLWIANATLFASLAIAGWYQSYLALATIFVAIHLLQNLWRPILISRFDDHADADEGATVLSIESQAQRLATMCLAPIIGWMVDTGTQNANDTRLWPIGVIGLLACGLILVQRKTPTAMHVLVDADGR